MKLTEISLVSIPEYLLTTEQKEVIKSKIEETASRLHVSLEDAIEIVSGHNVDELFGTTMIVAKLHDEVDDELGYDYDKTALSPSHRRRPGKGISLKKTIVDEEPKESKERVIKIRKPEPKDYIVLKFKNEDELLGAYKMWSLAGFDEYKVLTILVDGKKKEITTRVAPQTLEETYIIEEAFGE